MPRSSLQASAGLPRRTIKSRWLPHSVRARLSRALRRAPARRVRSGRAGVHILAARAHRRQRPEPLLPWSLVSYTARFSLRASRSSGARRSLVDGFRVDHGMDSSCVRRHFLFLTIPHALTLHRSPHLKPGIDLSCDPLALQLPQWFHGPPGRLSSSSSASISLPYISADASAQSTWRYPACQTRRLIENLLDASVDVCRSSHGHAVRPSDSTRCCSSVGSPAVRPSKACRTPLWPAAAAHRSARGFAIGAALHAQSGASNSMPTRRAASSAATGPERAATTVGAVAQLSRLYGVIGLTSHPAAPSVMPSTAILNHPAPAAGAASGARVFIAELQTLEGH